MAKEDIHITFQRNRLILTWGTGEIHEREEDGVIYREHVRKMYHRTLPLPEGTRVRKTFLVLCMMDCIDLIFVVRRDTCPNDWQRPYTKIPQYAMLPSRELIKIW